ncbi:MAG: hypothetical protein E7326_08070 [Clostridiales bacterium]|nr:hypothetical protein [Clostridiales bacterium]
MDQKKFHLLVWKYGTKVLRPFIKWKFNIDFEPFHAEGPCLIIANHVTSWDPLLLAAGASNHQMYFVASEHLFRKGFVTKLIHFLVAPIARKKGSSGADTAMQCLRSIRKGNSVCIFGEGEVTWDGVSHPSFEGTGTLARACGGSLVTYRFEGGHLSRPRWAKRIRKGHMKGHIVNVYTKDQLRAMTADEVAAAIDQDLYEDAYARQQQHPVAFRGSRLADRMETAAFLCPRCEKTDGLKGEGDFITCRCGFKARFTPYGALEPADPFRNFKEWDHWQHERLTGMFEDGTLPDFYDEDGALIEILDGHEIRPISQGALGMKDFTLSCMGASFPLREIDQMAIVQTNILLFSHQGKYYELRTRVGVNLRKYLHIWKLCRQNG